MVPLPLHITSEPVLLVHSTCNIQLKTIASIVSSLFRRSLANLNIVYLSSRSPTPKWIHPNLTESPLLVSLIRGPAFFKQVIDCQTQLLHGSTSSKLFPSSPRYIPRYKSGASSSHSRCMFLKILHSDFHPSDACHLYLLGSKDVKDTKDLLT